MTFKISYEANPNPHDIQVLGNGIMQYAMQIKGHAPIEFFAFLMRDDNDQIVAGCNGAILYGCLHIDQLWVAEHLRANGHGSKIILAAEKFGKDCACTFAVVNTMDWEALGFYKKLGYFVEFERHGFVKNSIFYFLRKALVN